MYVSRCKYVYAHAGFQKIATQHMLPAILLIYTACILISLAKD